ncbi:MAG TPA: hypothetical protein VMT87_16870 [Vicinamibacteria bacterium]|nr:hypothetical protein [Vicinamibacteria bacterium]
MTAARALAILDALRAADVAQATRVEPAPPAATLSLKARVLLWDFERGSLAYDLLCLLLVLLLLLVPAAWWSDPMIPRR